MEGFVEKTVSLCPQCLRRIPAERVAEKGNIYLKKSCPEHGDFKTLYWQDAKLYRDWGYGEEVPGPKIRFTRSEQSCPYDCGICLNHRAETCTVLMEVTRRCDLTCPVCFAGAHKNHDYHPNMDQIRGMYETILEAGGPYPLQLTGGEPTVRDDLPEIVALGKEMGFQHIQINTNGLRIAKDKAYLRSLKESGANLIYLQFDGISDDIYRYTRGANLFKLKLQAIENCAEVKIGVLLVPTLIPKVNDHQIGDIVRFAKQWIPVVKGVHFQPITYLGRYPISPQDEDRITIPAVLQALELQTAGEIKAIHFVPRRCKDSHCAFSGFFVLREDGKLLATTLFKSRESPICGSGYIYPHESPAEHVRRFIYRHLRYVEANQRDVKLSSWESFFQRAETHYLSISCMTFQDVWNFDLGKIRGCCIHVVTLDKRLIPFCAFYLTSIGGERLHQVATVSSVTKRG